MVPLLVQGKVLGMANGIMMTALNTCLFGEPYIVGELKVSLSLSLSLSFSLPPSLLIILKYFHIK